VNINDRHVHLVNGEHEEKDNDIEKKKFSECHVNMNTQDIFKRVTRKMSVCWF